jgi:colanic acid/amylovoran biosynthesis glycosyltransferase
VKIAYLINQYPKISHSFVRREIFALEALGMHIERVTIRKVNEPVVADEDIAELQRTTAIIDKKNAVSFLVNFVFLAPHIARVLKSIWLLSNGTPSKWFKHIIYAMEAAWLVRFCKKKKIDHIHAHFGTNSATVALLCYLMGGPRFSFTVHGPEEFDSPKELALRYKIQHAHSVIAISNFGKSQLFRWARWSDWNKIHVVRCAIDSRLIMQSDKAIESPYRLVCIGRLSEQKGQWLLLQAIAILAKRWPDVHLKMIGDGEFRAIFEAYIKENNLSHHVEMLGWRSEKNVLATIDGSAALVIPSFAEGLPVVIMESFARATPVIATHIAGIPELVNNTNGLLVVPGSLDSLVAQLEAFFALSNAAQKSMGLNGKASVQALHNSLTEAEKLKNLFMS